MTDTSKVALIVSNWIADPSPTLSLTVPHQTGASTGIGNSLSRLLASNGYRVAAVARSAAKLQTLCHGINAEADGAEKAAAFTLDVQDQKAAEQVVDEVLAKFGRIDVLVNNVSSRDSADLSSYCKLTNYFNLIGWPRIGLTEAIPRT